MNDLLLRESSSERRPGLSGASNQEKLLNIHLQNDAVCAAQRQVPGRSTRPEPGDASGFPSWHTSMGFGPHTLALMTARNRVWFLRAAVPGFPSPVLFFKGTRKDKPEWEREIVKDTGRVADGKRWPQGAVTSDGGGLCGREEVTVSTGPGASQRPRLLWPCSGSVLLQGFSRDLDASLLSGRGGQSLAAWASWPALSNPCFTPHCKRPRGGHPRPGE